jgi:hypothetical protein
MLAKLCSIAWAMPPTFFALVTLELGSRFFAWTWAATIVHFLLYLEWQACTTCPVFFIEMGYHSSSCFLCGTKLGAIPFVNSCPNFLVTGVLFRKALLVPVCQSIFPMFSCISFSVSGLTSKSLIHFEVAFMQGDRSLVSFFYMWICNFPSTISWTTVFYSVYVFGSFVENQMAVVCGCISGSSSPLVCVSGFLFVCLFLPVPRCFNYHDSVV